MAESACGEAMMKYAVGHLCSWSEPVLRICIVCCVYVDPYDSGEPLRPRVNSDSRKGDAAQQRSSECVCVCKGWFVEDGRVGGCLCTGST